MTKAIKYQIKAAESPLDAARGWLATVQEIWVEQPDGKSFCFNDKGGVFFWEVPRLGDDTPTEEIELDPTIVEKTVAFLEIKGQLLDLFPKEKKVGR